MLQRFKVFLFGRPRDPRDPDVYHKISLVAFLAWVGLGADGLSSSCYGPERAFLALEAYRPFALYLAFATALTVFVIASNFTRLLELFPSGGGAYLAVSRLLGPYAGLATGCALVVSYVLTISISIAGGTDALFSVLPLSLHPWKLPVASAVVGALVVLNLRGVRESVTSLLPIFLAFLATHAVVILAAFLQNLSGLPQVAHDTVEATRAGVRELGWFGVLAVLVRAYSLGGGTYTGIEAVSNAVPVLREPRVETGKRTMQYMAASLAFTAGGVILAYLLLGVSPEPGRTLNAVLTWRLTESWGAAGTPFGQGFYTLTMASEGALLFVASQAGFIGGPRVVANMAVDSWLPHQFANLSGRLVTQNAILFMGLAALGVLVLTGGSVDRLLVVYAINVLLVFTSALAGLARREWNRRKAPGWAKPFLLSSCGFLLTALILSGIVLFKFAEGAWATLLMTGLLCAGCLAIRGHYDRVRRAVRRLDRSLGRHLARLPGVAPRKRRRDPKAPTAALLVSGYSGLGVHALFTLLRLFPRRYRNVVFLSVGRVDSDRLKSDETVEELRFKVEEDLYEYVKLARRLGLFAEYRLGLGTDTVDELEKLCDGVVRDFPDTVFFAGKLIFRNERPWTRLLHNQSALELQRRLIFKGMNMVILPVRVG